MLPEHLRRFLVLADAFFLEQFQREVEVVQFPACFPVRLKMQRRAIVQRTVSVEEESFESERRDHGIIVRAGVQDVSEPMQLPEEIEIFPEGK